MQPSTAILKFGDVTIPLVKSTPDNMLQQVIDSGLLSNEEIPKALDAANDTHGAEMAEYIVTMHNSLVRAAHGLSLNEKRVIVCCASMLNGMNGSALTDHLSGHHVLRLHAMEYAELFDLYPTHAYRDLKAACDRLFDREFTTFSPSTGLSSRNRWVYIASYHKKKGYVELAFSPKVFPFLQHLRRDFSQYKLKQACAIRCVYTYRLFEVLNSWRSTGRFTCTLDEFRRIMEVPASYTASAINTRIIIPSLTVVSDSLGTTVTYEPEKSGKRITGWTFYIGEGARRRQARPNSRCVKQATKSPRQYRRSGVTA
ncbi:replication initiation protein [Edwardsiella tarda]|uniref:replication initiation protein n=1 Tax=Edwardsiella tarda TaxID=636 RepID=UPI00031FD0E3|nr:replication initiation protein [Edwardsiella tarda]